MHGPSLKLHRRRQRNPTRVADRDVQIVDGGGIVDGVEQVLDVELKDHRLLDFGVVGREDIGDV